MKFSDVRNLMERNRALTEFCSLPVVIMKDGEKTVTWFNFSLGKSEEQLCAKVREILDTRDGKELNRTKSEISVPVDKDKTSVPEISPEGILSGTGKNIRKILQRRDGGSDQKGRERTVRGNLFRK